MYKIYPIGIYYFNLIEIIPVKVYHILMKEPSSLMSALVKQERKRTGMTQIDLAMTAGVGLRFVRDLEQGKTTLRLDKVDQVLRLFGYRTGPVRQKTIDA